MLKSLSVRYSTIKNYLKQFATAGCNTTNLFKITQAKSLSLQKAGVKRQSFSFSVKPTRTTEAELKTSTVLTHWREETLIHGKRELLCALNLFLYPLLLKVPYHTFNYSCLASIYGWYYTYTASCRFLSWYLRRGKASWKQSCLKEWFILCNSHGCESQHHY